VNCVLVFDNLFNLFIYLFLVYLVEALCYKLEGRRFKSREGGFFNPSNRTMALGSTQTLTEMSTRNLPGGKKRPARRADNLTAIGEPIV
jgi:hypothetical protein